MKKRFSDEQIISILRKAEAGVSAHQICRKHAISDAIFYSWRKKFGDISGSGSKAAEVSCRRERQPDYPVCIISPACQQLHGLTN